MVPRRYGDGTACEKLVSVDDDGTVTAAPGYTLMPAPGTVWALVIADMAGRDALGLRKYGRPLLPNDGRDSLQDLYEELLDAAVYIKKAMLERDSAQNVK